VRCSLGPNHLKTAAAVDGLATLHQNSDLGVSGSTISTHLVDRTNRRGRAKLRLHRKSEVALLGLSGYSAAGSKSSAKDRLEEFLTAYALQPAPARSRQECDLEEGQSVVWPRPFEQMCSKSGLRPRLPIPKACLLTENGCICWSRRLLDAAALARAAVVGASVLMRSLASLLPHLLVNLLLLVREYGLDLGLAVLAHCAHFRHAIFLR
jgi:hypothetical protein